MFNKLFHYMLDHGVYLPPCACECWFLNNALTIEDLDKTIKILKDFLAKENNRKDAKNTDFAPLRLCGEKN